MELLSQIYGTLFLQSISSGVAKISHHKKTVTTLTTNITNLNKTK